MLDILNEDARIMGDCNDNDTPLEVDTSLEEAEEYGEYSMTHTAHRDEECYGCATQRYSCEHDEENKYDNPRDLLRFIMEVATASSKANWGNDKDWQRDFQFIVTEIDEFLNG